MKVKEIERTANVAWSPASQYPVYLACGTAAQQLDATFSTKSAIELFRFNPEDPKLDCVPVAAVETDHRFNKVVWGNLGIDDGHASGVVVGGTDNGLVCVWDASKLIMQESDCQLLSLDKHVGNVGALDFNKFQDNLLASGGSDSEILLWDLNNPTTPMTPGAKSQPSDDVTCLSWNCQVQHILASALNTRCVVWDLRKSEPIIKISDSMSRIKSKLVTWHPEVATQLLLSSEDDHSPVIQLWDLRFAASPLKVLERHTRGILSMAWSRADPDLLISCGKDNRLLCWNPNADVVGGEVTYELPMGNQWCFDVQWCPRNPQCLSACSFDGRVAVYSIMGGEVVTQTLADTSKIADSFGGFDNVAPTHTMPKVEKQIVPQISKAPKWLKRPCGASFAFGGKLVSFSSSRSTDSGQITQNKVNIHKVITEGDMLSHSAQLEHALQNRQFAEFCSLKITNSEEKQEETVWQFLKVNFEHEPRNKYLNILGFDAQEISQKVFNTTSSGTDVSDGELSSNISALTMGDELVNGGESVSASDTFDKISQPSTVVAKELRFNTTDDGSESLLTQALLTGHLEDAVELCIHEGRMADAIILANTAGPALMERTMKRYFKQCKGSTSSLISAVVQKNYVSVVENTSLENWKETLAMILTYGSPTEFLQLCDKLGARLEASPHRQLSSNAVLCYICSGNIEKFVECWIKQSSEMSNSSFALQELIEKVMMLRKAVEQLHGQEYSIPAGSSLANKLGQYAELLAAEGNLATALGYLTGVAQSQKLSILKHRLQISLGQHVTSSPWPAVTVRAAPSSQINPSKHVGRVASNPYGQPSQLQNYPTASQSHSPSNYNNQPAPVIYSAYNGAAAVTTTTPSYGAYTSQPSYQTNYPTLTSYAQPNAPTPSYQPAPVPSYSAPSYTGAAGTDYTSSTGTGYTGSTGTGYTGSTGVSYAGSTGGGYPGTLGAGYAGSTGSGFTGYGQAQPVGHVASRGLLSKKYASPVTNSVSDTSQQKSDSSSQSAPQSFYNPNSANISLMSTGPGIASSYSPGSIYSPGSANAFSTSAPSVHAQQYQPPAAPALLVPTIDAARSAPSGWNDPPPVHGKEPESPNATTKTAPITVPVFNPAAQQPMQPMMGGDSMYAGQNHQYAAMEQQQQHHHFYGNQYHQAPQQQQYTPALSPKLQDAPVEVVKAPIPEKHKGLKDTLDALANKCLHASSNPQQKRKLEDVLKKLEYLYDKLRQQSLSETILQGLNQIVASIKQYDYNTGLAVHTNMVSQGNFSEISAFMPGLKMLMQTAIQLQVFV